MKYIKEDLEVLLKNHKKDEAKITELQAKIESYEERLNYAGYVYESTENETIEGMQLGSNYSEIPSGKTNKITNITEQTAINYHKELVHINQEDREYLEKQIIKLEDIKKELNKKVARTKNLLNQLSDEEEFVIRTYYMNKSKWDFVYDNYFQEYKKQKSIKQLQNIRDTAIESMLEVLNIGME